MINAVGREIPDEILRKMKKPVFTGAYETIKRQLQKADVLQLKKANQLNQNCLFLSKM